MTLHMQACIAARDARNARREAQVARDAGRIADAHVWIAHARRSETVVRLIAVRTLAELKGVQHGTA